MASVNTTIQVPLVNPAVNPQSPDSDMEANEDEIVNKLINNINKIFSYQQFHNVKEFIKAFMNPKNPFKPVGLPAFNQSLFFEFEIEEDNFHKSLEACGLIKIVAGQASCQALSTYVFDKLVIALQRF